MAFLRALTAFLALPGIVAFAIPAWLLARTGQLHVAHPVGLVPLAVGLVGLLWCVRDFLVKGRGTLAPWDPPRALVETGLYRLSRNPMYLSVLLLLLGWALTSGARVLFIYTAVIAVAFHLRVVFGEEPWLARTHGAAWTTYRDSVPRWLGRPVRRGAGTPPAP